MIQEYLFMNDHHRISVEGYIPDGIKKEIYDVENSNCWIVTFILDGDNESCAKSLSEVNDYILSHFNPTVLTNESASYFNKKLFPLINEFERKLRKLLYLKSALYQGEMKVDNIQDLETKDLGEIFTLLFTDADFVKKAKGKINEKTWQFTKREIISALQSLTEDTVWDALIGSKAVDALADNFIAVKEYRNDVMHAHNINTATYRAAKRLFAQLNEQIGNEISSIIQTVEERPEAATESDFNSQLSAALQTQNASTSLQDAMNTIIDLTDVRSDSMAVALKQIEEYVASIRYPDIESSLKPLIELSNNSEWLQLQQDIRDSMTNVISPKLRELQSQIRETVALTSEAKKEWELLHELKTPSLSATITEFGETPELLEYLEADK